MPPDWNDAGKRNGPEKVMKPPVSAEARGRVRELAATLEISSTRMAAALARLPTRTLEPWRWKGPIGRERAITKIRHALPVAPELSIPTKAVWRYIAPAPLPTAKGEDARPGGPGFIVMGIIAGDKNRLIRCETFGCAFTEHAIGRLLDRSNFRQDPTAAMLEAHGALTFLEEDEGDRLFDLQDAQMPTVGGAFLATPGRFGLDSTPLMIAKTWVPRDMLYADQASDLAAWCELLTPLA